MPAAALVSFRLGGTDGVSVESAKWAGALRTLSWQVFTVAGGGPVDHLLPGLAMSAEEPPTTNELHTVLAPADLVVVENLCSLPLNPRAAAVVAGVCRDRPALLHHHDLPWQRPQFADRPPPPDDRRWAHVTINEISRHELAGHGISAVTIYNAFDLTVLPGSRVETRRALEIDDGAVLVLQPTRALPRKNIPGGLRLAEELGATYWLLGPAEDGFGSELDRLLGAARVPVRHGPGPGGAGSVMADAYAACDVVALPSTWEGFGNPAIESAVHRRALAIGPYPVARELARFGFEWFGVSDAGPLTRWLVRPDASLLERNRSVAARYFNLLDLPRQLEGVLAKWGLATLNGPSTR